MNIPVAVGKLALDLSLRISHKFLLRKLCGFCPLSPASQPLPNFHVITELFLKLSFMLEKLATLPCPK